MKNGNCLATKYSSSCELVNQLEDQLSAFGEFFVGFFSWNVLDVREDVRIGRNGYLRGVPCEVLAVGVEVS